MGERSFAWRVVGLLALAAVVLFPVAAGLMAYQQRIDPPSCTGIGFGCELGPWPTATLLILLFYLPAVAVLAAVVGLLSLGGDRLTVARSYVALLGAIVIGVAVLVFGAGALT